MARILWTLSGHVSDELGKSLQGHPKLWTEPLGMSLGEANPTTHTLILGIRVYNGGTPTVLWDWHLTIKSPSPKQNPFEVPLVPDHVDLTLTSGTLANVVYGSNSLVLTARYEPIQHGSMRDGYVAFIIPETPRGFLEFPETKYQLTFRDIERTVVTQVFNSPTPLPTR